MEVGSGPQIDCPRPRIDWVLELEIPVIQGLGHIGDPDHPQDFRYPLWVSITSRVGLGSPTGGSSPFSPFSEF
ncbi:hypothetical protein CRG98_011050 [Punica granatum]|nr:hypothetical protein CRG98_011050 [Punica granatum]